MIQVFNEQFPADAPFTPESQAALAAMFEQTPEGTRYATAVEYIDAFVEYVIVLETELGSPVGDSQTFVMEKYGGPITGNPNFTAYVTARLEEEIGG
jgi:hypothetical protein